MVQIKRLDGTKARHHQYLHQKQASRLQQEELAFGQKGDNVGKSMTTFQEKPNNNKSLLETRPTRAAPPHVNVVRPWKQPNDCQSPSIFSKHLFLVVALVQIHQHFFS